MGFSRHGVVVRFGCEHVALFGVSLPSLTILHLSAPGAWCALEESEIDLGWIAYCANSIFVRYARQTRSNYSHE